MELAGFARIALQVGREMKVFTLTPWYLPFLGGIEILVSTLAKSLQKYAVNIAVVTDDLGKLPNRDVIDGTPVYRLNFTGAVRSGQPGAPLQVLRQLCQILDDGCPDILHMHCVTGSSAWYVDRILKPSRYQGHFVVTQHGILEPIDRMPVIRDLLKRADALTGVSEAALSSSLEFAGECNSRGVIPNGIDVAPAPASILGCRAPFELVCVGRLQHEKGFDVAIRALDSVRRYGFDATLTVIGIGECRQNLEDLVQELGLRDQVCFLGQLANGDTRRIIASASLVLVPSRTREGFSLVAAEGAMAGVPAIVSRVGGLPETVVDGQTGLVVAPDNPNELAAAIVRLLEDEASRAILGARAKSRALEKYDMARCIDKYLELYRSLVN
jgi:glycogen(starch) synthase